jgi:hypothetical protein
MNSIVYEDLALVNVYSTKDMKNKVVPAYLSFLKSTKTPVMITTTIHPEIHDPTYRRLCATKPFNTLRYKDYKVYQAKDFCVGGKFDRYVREYLEYQKNLWHKLNIPAEISVAPKYFSSITI